jgi:hypothetical protein
VAIDDPELAQWLESYRELLDAMRRLTTLIERLAARASLSADEARDVRHELETTRTPVEHLDAVLTLRKQRLRPM